MCVTIHFGPMGAHFTFSPNQSKKKTKTNKNKKQTNKKTKTKKQKQTKNKTKPSGQNFASPTGTVGENDLKMHKDLAQCPTSIIKRITVKCEII